MERSDPCHGALYYRANLKLQPLLGSGRSFLAGAWNYQLITPHESDDTYGQLEETPS